MKRNNNDDNLVQLIKHQNHLVIGKNYKLCMLASFMVKKLRPYTQQLIFSVTCKWVQ